MRYFSLLILSFLGTLCLGAQDKAKGKLFIIGGGSRSTELMRELISVSDMRSHDFIAILPMASEEPDTSFYYIREDFRKVTNLPVINLTFQAGAAVDPGRLDSLAKAKIIFITGGDQLRFMKAVLHTPIYEAIHKAYGNGSTIAGTSAGAAVMSKKMITGNALIGDTAYHETFSILQNKNLEIKEGLGLIDSAIIDQHFIVRSRYNRLLSALAAYPGYTCIGIDESTAIVVYAQRVRVTGKGQVVVLSDPQHLFIIPNGDIKMSDLRFSIYTAGDIFYLRSSKKKKPM